MTGAGPPPGPVPAAPADRGLPPGFGLGLGPGTVEPAPGVLFGGSPARILRLTPGGRAALAALRDRPVESPATARLGRRLSDAGMAHPRPPELGTPPEATVVVPVRDRSAELDSCLAALGHEHPVVVVDDGSRDPAAVAAVARAHGARLLVLSVNTGPGPARNRALADVTTPWVAFCDSDCRPPTGWVDQLARHGADPTVAAVAARLVPAPAGNSLRERWSSLRSPLDLGPRAAGVAPMTRVSYVPTAALLVRRSALGRPCFDESLRYGEDVDLVWRLIAAGWRVRYEPAVVVHHAEPGTWRQLLQRRHHYGTSAAPLARRHPGGVAPLVLQPWPTAAVAALLGRRPVPAAVAYLAGVGLLGRRVRAARLPARGVAKPVGVAVIQTWRGVGRWGTQFAAPLLLAALARPGGRDRRTRWGRRAAVVSLLVGPSLLDRPRGAELGPAGYLAAALADDVAYGSGVWRGAWRERTVGPLVPAVRSPLPRRRVAAPDRLDR